MTKARIGTPLSEFEIDSDLVRRLLVAQQPDLAELPIEPVDAGWDNAIFRVGAAWAARLPRRFAAVSLLEREQRWLGRFGALPFAIPTVARIGHPGEGYPWMWSIVPWLSGTPADLLPPDEAQAEPLARFLASLHVSAPKDAPKSDVRGVPLINRAAVVEQRLKRLELKTSLITAASGVCGRMPLRPRKSLPQLGFTATCTRGMCSSSRAGSVLFSIGAT